MSPTVRVPVHVFHCPGFMEDLARTLREHASTLSQTGLHRCQGTTVQAHLALLAFADSLETEARGWRLFLRQGHDGWERLALFDAADVDPEDTAESLTGWAYHYSHPGGMYSGHPTMERTRQGRVVVRQSGGRDI